MSNGQISTPFFQWIRERDSMSLDVVVVGSGYGGAVAALRLAEAGRKVVVLERGSEYLPGQFPNQADTAVKHLRSRGRRGLLGRASGVFDWHVAEQVVALVANGVGGGSLINAGVAIEPVPEVFAQPEWPAALRGEGAHMSLAQAFAVARSKLGIHQGTLAHLPAKGRALCRLGTGAQAVDLTVDPARCTRCGDCASGCNWGAKRTLRDTYLAEAVARGARLVNSATVLDIAPDANGWELRVWATERYAALLKTPELRDVFEKRLTAAGVVLAAGTLGSTEILQRSTAVPRAMQLSKRLGERFSANGDSLTFLVNDPEDVNAFGAGAPADKDLPADFGVGTTITAMLDGRRGPNGEPIDLEKQVLVQDGAIPAPLARLTEEMLATSYLLRELDRPRFVAPRGSNDGDDLLAAGAWRRHTQVLLAMGHDRSAGRIVWNGERSIPTWPPNPEEAPAYRSQAELFRQFEAEGRAHLHPLTWQTLPESASVLMSGPRPTRKILTVHPLGGCAMGDNIESGVVDHLGRPFNPEGGVWDNLWVMDGSIIPTALGANPLLTITALAERAVAALLGRAPPEPATPGRAAKSPVRRPVVPPLPAPVDATITERLVATRLRGVEQRFHCAELILEMGSTDWLQMWRSASHRVDARGGTLRLEVASPAPGTLPPTASSYSVVDGWFELLPDGGVTPYAHPARASRVGEVHEWCRAFFTWLLARGFDDTLRARRDRKAAGQKSFGLAQFRDALARFHALKKALAHAAERREMRYRLNLRREGSDATLPRTLTLLGRKEVRYGAQWTRLLGNAYEQLFTGRREAGVPSPKPTFWEQVFNPDIVVLDGPVSSQREALARWSPQLADAWVFGRFEVDISSLLMDPPLRLGTGDLTLGLEALGGYPSLFARYAMKTQLLDFRLPDYDKYQTQEQAQARRVSEPMVLQVGDYCVRPCRYDLLVPRGHSDADPPTGLRNELDLVLWRYKAPESQLGLRKGTWGACSVWKAPSVLLLHAFAQSGSMFTLPEPHPSLARELLRSGFDVWVLDHRISIRLAHTKVPSNMVQIARHDIPAAVDRMLGVLAQEHAAELAQCVDPLLQVFAMGQCVGGASLAISMLDGALSHGVSLSNSGPPGPLEPMLSKLAGVVISQTHPFLIGTPQTRAKTWVPAFIRDAAGLDAVPFAVHGAPSDTREAWLDRLLASMPVPPDEHCPRELDRSHPQDDCATCRRIRFIEAPLFRHVNLLPQTHEELPFLFGDANVHLFAHAARCVENERLVDEEGGYVFVTDHNMRKHFSVPVVFMHGDRNELFHPSSARRSGDQYARLFPALSRRAMELVDPSNATSPAWIIPGHGHVDVILGKQAPALVFRPMANLFRGLLDYFSDSHPRPVIDSRVTLRAPLLGPMIGAVSRSVDEARIRIAFLIDDRFSDAKAGPLAARGLRTWAIVRSHARVRRYHVMKIRDGRRPRVRLSGSAGYRVAHGELRIPLGDIEGGIPVLAFSLHEALIEQSRVESLRANEFEPLHERLDDLDLTGAPNFLAESESLDTWFERLLKGREEDVRRGWNSANVIDPARRNVSLQRRDARSPSLGSGFVHPASVRATEAESAYVEFFAGGCRYPGWPIDRGRVDAAARRLLAEAEAPGSELAFGLLLGDQIYADATAGIVDPLTSVERFFERYKLAFGRELGALASADRHGLGDVLARLPTYMTADDHEYRDGFPDGRAVDARFVPSSARGRRSRMIASEALNLFQGLHMPPRLRARRRNYVFKHSPVRFFVLDTRTERVPLADNEFRPTLIRQSTLDDLQDWLNHEDAGGSLNCIASGSVILPRLLPGSDPTSLEDDTTGWSQSDRNAILTVIQNRPLDARVLLLSGDYHFSAIGSLVDRASGATFGAAVVIPPLYAPLGFANARGSDIDVEEDLSAFGMRLAFSKDRYLAGSGFCKLRVERRRPGYRIIVSRWVQRHDLNEQDGRHAPEVVLDIT